jgi:PAS domain S-box-containing protein
MSGKRVLLQLRSSITAKVCFFGGVTAAALLCALGLLFYRGYAAEIEHGLADRMALPAALMSQMAMNFEAAADLPALEKIVQEPVVEAYVARKDGTIFYASAAARVGGKEEAADVQAGQDAAADRRLRASTEAGGARFSLRTPVVIDGDAVGHLFVKVDAAGVMRKERHLAGLLALGIALTVLLTSLITAFWIRRLLVPRLDRTVDALRQVGSGRLSIRIAESGAPDEIGLLIQSVNAMITQVETYTMNLQSLAQAGGEFANVETRSDLEQTLQRTLAARFGATPAGGGDNQIFLSTLEQLRSDAAGRIDALARLRRAEQEYRELFSNAVEGIFRLSPAGRLEAANASFAATLGFPADAELPERFEGFLRSRPDLQQGWNAFLEKVRDGGEVRDSEFAFSRDDGSPVWIALSARAIVDAQGRPAGVDGGAVDISDRKHRETAESRRAVAEAAHRAKSEVLAAIEEKNRQLERALEELRRAQERLVQSEKMAAMGTMAAGVAHDLNNILSGIVGYPDLLLTQLPKSSPLRESLAAIKASGERAAAVVSDLLTIARGSAYATVPCDLNGLIRIYLQSPECRQLMQRFPGIRIVPRLAGDLNASSCAPIRMQKVVMNLVMNACEAIRDTGVVVISTVNTAIGPNDALARSVPPGDYVVLKVADTGPGITEQDLARVFEPFFSKKVLGRSGTGLGLAVVWNTVVEHGGAVVAESGADGAVFSVFLPASEEAPTPEKHPETPREILQGSGTVLVVDDEPLLREIATKILAVLGYRVEAVASGEEAIARLQERLYDLIVLDMLMPPGINGCETYREIVKFRPGQKAVICSGFSLSEDFIEARKAGAGSFLKKPYTFDELGLAVKRELARPAGEETRTD